MIQHLTKDTFTQATEGVSLIDFWATWCGPCNMLAPTIEELDKEFEGKVFVGKVNVDQEPDLSSQFEVMSIPTILILKDGVEVQRIIGVRSKQKFLDSLNEVLSPQAAQ